MPTRREAKLTRPQAEMMVPGGLAPKERSQHHALTLEPAEIASTGRAVVMRQAINTPIRKLLIQGAITVIEADAAALLRADHDVALASSRSILDQAGCRVDADNRGNDGSDLRFDRLRRFGLAMKRLGPDLAAVASAAIVEDHDIDGGAFRGVGARLLPSAGASEQTGAGKAAIALTCRSLAIFYGLRRQAA